MGSASYSTAITKRTDIILSKNISPRQNGQVLCMSKELGNIYAENVGYPQTQPALRVEIYENGYEVEERIIPVTKNQQRYCMSLSREKRVKYISKKIRIE